MLAIAAPHGATIQVPSLPSEEERRYPEGLSEMDAARSYYDEHGYVVIRNCVEHATCDRARAAFESEVKPYDGFIYRQASANPERHVWTEHGYMLNSLLNVHATDPVAFPTFRRAGTALITSPGLHAASSALLRDSPTLVQSMYFEGNPATWAHQDTYYLDSEELGRMTAAWIALEDIAPGAGRFYVYPGSHKLELAMNRGALSIAGNHDTYKRLIVSTLLEHGLECRAPALRKGDVLFWNARTIHGSLPTTQPQYSRSSMTAHYIPSSKQFMQFQVRPKRTSLSRINGMHLHTPKDLGSLRNRVVLRLETRFPRAFKAAKTWAVRMLTR
jgi:phytanoyl-CoA hydroxylase